MKSASIDPHLSEQLKRVDPELRDVALQMFELYRQFTPMSLERLAARRATLSAMVAEPSTAASVEQRIIAGSRGMPDVAVYLVNANPADQRAAILHTHGGGFTASSARASVPGLQEAATALDCTIVSVEYRNAPETRHDGSLEDNYAALRWLHGHADEIGVDRTRIALMGESGGGGHAALLAIAARDRGEFPLVFQALLYPMIDDRTGSSRPSPPHRGVFNWGDDANRFGWRCFLGEEPGTAHVPEHAVPSRVKDLSGLPPAFIGVGELDIFVDENIEYARRLLEAGIAVELLVVPGAFHGFDMLARRAAVSRGFTAAKLAALKRALATR
ncbi:MAG TPA: alpha/beta hydrolase [Steroidobacteraceae bacterium]|jgi:acetyl esterase/lipase|nr:alpha/beta hydrolase [Steroidobacteraceae bacterium]